MGSHLSHRIQRSLDGHSPHNPHLTDPYRALRDPSRRSNSRCLVL